MLQEYCFTFFPADVMIGFNPTDYTVSEDGGSVTFFIQKIGSNERDVTVFFSTVDGSATGKTTLRQQWALHRCLLCNDIATTEYYTLRSMTS